MWLGIECMCGMSDNCKALFQVAAANVESRTSISRSIWMNRMRSKFFAILMLNNARILQAAGRNIINSEYNYQYGI